MLFGSLKGIKDEEKVEEEVEVEEEEEKGEEEEEEEDVEVLGVVELLGSLNGIRELLIVELTVVLLELFELVEELVKVELVKVGVTVEEVITNGMLDTWKTKIILASFHF